MNFHSEQQKHNTHKRKSSLYCICSSFSMWLCFRSFSCSSLYNDLCWEISLIEQRQKDINKTTPEKRLNIIYAALDIITCYVLICIEYVGLWERDTDNECTRMWYVHAHIKFFTNVYVRVKSILFICQIIARHYLNAFFTWSTVDQTLSLQIYFNNFTMQKF